MIAETNQDNDKAFENMLEKKESWDTRHIAAEFKYLSTYLSLLLVISILSIRARSLWCL